MESASKAQIDYLTKLQAEYLKDQAEGFFTQYASLEEYAANTDLTFILKSAEAEFEKALDYKAPAWKLTPAEQAEVARYAKWADLAVTTREAIAKAEAEGEPYFMAMLSALRSAKPQIREITIASKWETSKAMDAAAHADLTDISKAEASALIDLLK